MTGSSKIDPNGDESQFPQIALVKTLVTSETVRVCDAVICTLGDQVFSKALESIAIRVVKSGLQ